MVGKANFIFNGSHLMLQVIVSSDELLLCTNSSPGGKENTLPSPLNESAAGLHNDICNTKFLGCIYVHWPWNRAQRAIHR